MCILCVVQRWSRRVATMLPWLVLPLLLMWALSLLGPPHLRFEITSPRLACVSVLLVTAFWYEILMPQLSVWRARRSARLRERRRAQALELHKLRKAATRRCRNCLTPYRDQNPGGGRFMCFYCGHVSKRPVLDLPGGSSPSSRINGWICAQDWGAEGNGNWASPVPRYWVGNSGGGDDDRCMTERSYSGAFLFVCKLFSCFFVLTRWILRNVFRAGSSSEDVSDGDNKGLVRKGENGGSSQESRGEKARRKAEEKRQARLEKEMLEQEERKQREEVARLVEERRKLREEILEAERIHSRGSGYDGDREKRKESDKRRQERRKEKDKDRGSSKSNSDVEECERACRENEKKHEFDKKSELGRKDTTRTMADKYKLQALEAGNATKGVIASKQKYFDHVKGSFLTPSRGFNGASLFGRNAQGSAVTKVSKSSTGHIDHTQGSATRKETQFGNHIAGKSTLTADDRILKSHFNKAVGSEVRPQTPAPKKSWHHLFTCSSAVSPCDDMNTIYHPNQNGMSEAQSSQMADQRALHSHSLDNQINLMQPLPFRVHPAINGSIGDNVIPHLSPSEHIFSEQEQNSTLEEAEIFGDPCYDPDPVSLLGPVSDSLDNFPPDLVAGYDSQTKFGEPQNLKRISTIAEVSRPSPIESPISKSRVSEERHAVIGQPMQTIKTKNEANNANEQNTWQMWGTPLAQDELGLVAKSSGWFSPFGLGKSNQDIMMEPLSLNPMITQSALQNYSLPSVHSSLNGHGVNYQKGGTFNPFGHVLNENDIWTRDTLFKPLPVDEESRFLPLDLMDKTARNEMVYANLNSTEASHPFELPPANHWSKKDWPPPRGTQNAGNSIRAPHSGSLFSTGPDVQSVWDFNQKGKNIATIPSLLK